MKYLITFLMLVASSVAVQSQPMIRSAYTTNNPNATIIVGGPLLITPGYGGELGLGTNKVNSIDAFGNTMRFRGGSSGINWRSSVAEASLYNMDGTLPYLRSGDAANEVLSTVGLRPIGANVSSYFQFNGGSMAGVFDKPPRFHETQMQQTNNWVGMITSAVGLDNNNVAAGISNTTETNVISFCEEIRTNGILTTLTNAGIQAVAWFDTLWQHTNRTPSGTITWATNQFLRGIPWLIRHCESNQVGLILNMYYDPRFVRSPNTALLSPMIGTPSYLFPTEVSPFAWNHPQITANTVVLDVQTIYSWGLDSGINTKGIRGMVIQNTVPYNEARGYEEMRIHQFWETSLAPNDQGYRFNYFPYTNRPHALQIGAYCDRPHDFFAETANTININQFSVPIHSAPGLSFAMGYARTYWLELQNAAPNTVRPIFTDLVAGKDSWSLTNYQSFLSVAAMFNGCIGLVHTNGAWSSVVRQSLTNDLLFRLSNPSWREWPRKPYDGGSNSVWVSSISPTERKVLFVNESTTLSTNLSITKAQLGFTNGSTVVWSYASDPLQITNQVTAGDTFTHSTPLGRSALFKVSLVSAPAEQAFTVLAGSPNTNLVAKSSAVDTVTALEVRDSGNVVVLRVDSQPTVPGTTGIWGSGAPTAANYWLLTDNSSFRRVNLPAGGSFQIYDNNSTLIGTFSSAAGLNLTSGSYRHNGFIGITTNVNVFDGTITNQMRFSGGVLTNVVRL